MNLYEKNKAYFKWVIFDNFDLTFQVLFSAPHWYVLTDFTASLTESSHKYIYGQTENKL